ncbi:sulfite exporter TauE/SafE family protein [Afifella sp. IM 167]|uniref:sulfite exporter TauE/SafE family protein n=1 Tax=Afifella sp. IM 167 TaxID=2033586 RepID=UPI001CC97FEE|nr:sulfite exporter TauE/SafE family protein [Afifella sp. IM 167]MBZ8133076.1 hypothetical protein [Afifella sp. IM 167]
MLSEIIIIFLCLAGGGLVKGALGMGLPLIAVPGLAAFLGVPYALAVLTVPILVTNTWQMWRFRDHRHGLAFLPGLTASALVGIAIGTFMLTHLPAEMLSLGLAIVIAVYIALRVFQPQLQLSMEHARPLAPLIGLVAGALQGATGISAPVSVTYISAMRLARPAFVFSVSTLFTGFVLAQIPSLALAGVLTGERALFSACALLPVFLGMRLGSWLGHRLDARRFDQVILVLLALIAAKLVFDSGILG